MINIIGDNVHELIEIQNIIETGILNLSSNDINTIDIKYKLSSEDILLVNKYNHIIGSKSKNSEEDK